MSVLASIRSQLAPVHREGLPFIGAFAVVSLLLLWVWPPLSLRARWFAPHVAYTISKYGMSMCVLGMAEEFKERGIAVNALWPRSVIATAALNLLGGEDTAKHGRKAEIVADAAHAILTRPSRACTGNFFIDEDVLRSEGVQDFDRYAVKQGEPLMRDLFVDEA